MHHLCLSACIYGGIRHFGRCLGKAIPKVPGLADSGLVIRAVTYLLW